MSRDCNTTLSHNNTSVKCVFICVCYLCLVALNRLRVVVCVERAVNNAASRVARLNDEPFECGLCVQRVDGDLNAIGILLLLLCGANVVRTSVVRLWFGAVSRPHVETGLCWGAIPPRLYSASNQQNGQQ